MILIGCVVMVVLRFVMLKKWVFFLFYSGRSFRRFPDSPEMDSVICETFDDFHWPLRTWAVYSLLQCCQQFATSCIVSLCVCVCVCLFMILCVIVHELNSLVPFGIYIQNILF